VPDALEGHPGGRPVFEGDAQRAAAKPAEPFDQVSPPALGVAPELAHLAGEPQERSNVNQAQAGVVDGHPGTLPCPSNPAQCAWPTGGACGRPKVVEAVHPKCTRDATADQLDVHVRTVCLVTTEGAARQCRVLEGHALLTEGAWGAVPGPTFASPADAHRRPAKPRFDCLSLPF
jgi:hypothetical protein